MKAHVERCNGITIKSNKTPDINVYTYLWSKQKHQLKSTSSPDAQNSFSMSQNESDGNTEKKQKGQCYLCLSYANSALFVKNNSRHVDAGGADRLVQTVILGKNVNKAAFESDLMKWTQETRSIRSRALS